MLDAPGDHLVPVGVRVELRRRRLFALTHRQDVVVVQQVAWLAGRGIRAHQACQLFGFALEFGRHPERALAMVLRGDDAQVRALDQHQEERIRTQREQHDHEEAGGKFAQSHQPLASTRFGSASSISPTTAWTGNGR